jgi:hypothetical protein
MLKLEKAIQQSSVWLYPSNETDCGYLRVWKPLKGIEVSDGATWKSRDPLLLTRGLSLGCEKASKVAYVLQGLQARICGDIKGYGSPHHMRPASCPAFLCSGTHPLHGGIDIVLKSIQPPPLFRLNVPHLGVYNPLTTR